MHAWYCCGAISAPEKPRWHELDGLGIDDLVRDENNLVLVEWGEKFPRMVTMSDAEISITRAGTDGRKLRLSTGARK
jgi:tRNA A37 threonylcarbamoyladenosine biosynthesis protein TsaE